MASEEEKRAVSDGKKTCSPSGARVPHEQLLDKNAQLERRLAECTAELNEAKQRLQEEAAGCQKLREELRVFQMLVENAPDNIARHDHQCRYVYVNQQLASTVGMAADAFIGKAPVELLPGDPAIAAYQACMQKVLESGKPQDFELLLPDTGQGVGYHHIRIVAEFDEHGETTGALAIGRDVTDSKRFALDLAKREREFRTLAENLPDNIARYDRHCRLVYMNSNLETLQGVPLSERMGKMPVEVAPEQFYLNYHKLLATTIETGKPSEAVLEFSARGGNPRYHQIHFVAERDEHQEIVGALAIGRDVTERKQIERELHMLNCALDQAFDATYLIDADLRFRYVNEAAVRELGYSRDEFSVMTLLDIDPSVSVEMMQGLMKQAIEKGGVSNTVESFHRRKNGEVFPVEVGATAFNYEGEYLHLTTVRNITERKQAEKELYRHREQLEELVCERTADLQDSRASLAEAQRIAHVGSWEMNLVDNVLTWSDEIYRIFEIDPQAFGASYEAFMETVHPDERDRLDRIYKSSLEKREPFDIEHRLLLADGRVKYVRERCETVYDESGQALRSIGTVQDITELKLADQKLKQALAFTDQLIDAIPDPVFVKDRQHRWLRLNDAFCTLTGQPREALIGKSDYDFFSQKEAEVFWEKDEFVFASGKEHVNEEDFTGADGVTHTIQTKKVAITDSDGNEILIGIIHDITERKRMEKALATSEQEFRSLAESSPDRIVRYDREGRIRYLNSSLLRELKLKCADDVLGMRPSEAWPDSRFNMIEQAAALAVETEEVQNIEFTIAHESGLYYRQVIIVPERDVAGNIVGTLGFGRDITAIREAEKRLKIIADNMPGSLVNFRMNSDGSGQVLYANSGLQEMFALSSSAMENPLSPEDFLHRIHPDDLPMVREEMSRAATELQTYSSEFRVNHPQKGERWILQTSMPVYESESSMQWYSLMFDINERKQLEAELRDSRNFLEQVIHAIPDLLFEVDREGYYLNVWAQNPELLAAQKEELLGRRVHDVMTEENAQAAMAAIEDADKHGIAVGMDICIELPQGKRWFAHTLSKKPGARKSEDTFLVLSRDITVRKQFEEQVLELNARLEDRVRERTEQLEAINRELRESELRFRTLAENSPNIIVRYDLQCHRIYVNPAYLNETGMELEAALNETPDPQWAASMSISASEYRGSLERVMATGTPAEMYFSWRNIKTGRAVDFAVQMVAEYGPDGKVTGALMLAFNIAALKQAEQRLDESRKQLRQLSARRERDLEMERKRISRELHDELGQLLTALQLDVSLLGYELGQEAGEAQERLQSIQGLIDNAMKAARHVATQLRPAALDLGFLTALEWLTRRYSANTHIHCELHIIDCEDRDIDDECAIALYRITQESLTNVARHAQTEQVTVTLQQHSDALLLSIEDKGAGFDIRNVKEYSFGLLGIRERVMVLGGMMDIDSAPGQGTVVTVRIPLLDKGANS